MIEKKNSRIIWIAVIAVLIVIIGLVFYLKNSNPLNVGGSLGGEDGWIKNSVGIYVKHGNPSIMPPEVVEQKELLDCVNKTYYEWVKANLVFDSQCLGSCIKKYAVDVVHVPRTAVDDLRQNQCVDYLNGLYSNFVEIDKTGDVVRIQ